MRKAFKKDLEGTQAKSLLITPYKISEGNLDVKPSMFAFTKDQIKLSIGTHQWTRLPLSGDSKYLGVYAACVAAIAANMTFQWIVETDQTGRTPGTIEHLIDHQTSQLSPQYSSSVKYPPLKADRLSISELGTKEEKLSITWTGEEGKNIEDQVFTPRTKDAVIGTRILNRLDENHLVKPEEPESEQPKVILPLSLSLSLIHSPL